jgi:hypothetical protein
VSDNLSVEVNIAGTLIDLEVIGHQVGQAMESTIRDYGMLLQNEVRINASTGFHKPGQGHIPGTGPGPNVATGDYRRTIALSVSSGTLDGERAIEADVYTNSVQGARLEHGFVGVDSLGRVYRQPAYPHFKPAADTIEKTFHPAMRAAVEAVLARAGGASDG